MNKRRGRRGEGEGRVQKEEEEVEEEEEKAKRTYQIIILKDIAANITAPKQQ